MKNIPKIGDRYKHHSGRIYEVIMIANLDSNREDYPITVVYKGVNDKIWAKPLDNFNQKMQLD